ncbi:MAG: nuclear transport factor 2 family protein [Candidatus Dadabacteria bacterium]|nr:nuclear transport factor 2 family protein [Candidatus Dadabacteria bacterium]
MIHNHPILHLLVLMLGVTCLLSCTTAPPPDTSEEDSQAIKAASSQFVENFNSQDFAALAAIFTDAAKLIPPNFEMIVGRESIQVWFGESGANLQLTMIDLHMNGDMAYVVGEYMIAIQPEEGEALSDNGNYVEIWKRTNGFWMLDLDIWNSNVPLPVPIELFIR